MHQHEAPGLQAVLGPRSPSEEAARWRLGLGPAPAAAALGAYVVAAFAAAAVSLRRDIA